MDRPELPRMLAIGGSDSCGGAGIQADIKTGAALGVDVSTAITAITAQNSLGVHAIEPVSVELLRAQIASVCSDLPPHAVKLGMLYDAARVEVVADAIKTYKLRNVVCDPVLVSTSGTTLLDPKGAELLLSMLPLFTLFTPNAMEAAALTGIAVSNSSDLLTAGRLLLEKGANGVFLKGGHIGESYCTDVLLRKHRPDPIFLVSARVETRNDHGTGCVLASAISAVLALGNELGQAVESAHAFTRKALSKSVTILNGAGRGGMDLVSWNLD